MIATMKPGLWRGSAKRNVGNIAYLPTLTAQIKGGDFSPSIVAVIDTGAQMSVIDTSLWRSVVSKSAVVAPKAEQLTTTKGRREVHQLSISLHGDDETDRMDFDNVPTVIAPLYRPVMLLGHRGLLEWLDIRLDYPGRRITLTRPARMQTQYESLSSHFKNLESAIKLAESGNIAPAIMTLAWEMEQLLDRLAAQDEDLKRALQKLPTQHRTLGPLLQAASLAVGDPDLAQFYRYFVNARNIAAHRGGTELESVSFQETLSAAEQIVSRLTSAVNAKSG